MSANNFKKFYFFFSLARRALSYPLIRYYSPAGKNETRKVLPQVNGFREIVLIKSKFVYKFNFI